MKISAKTDYACRALIELSQHWPKTTPMGITAIADNQNIPIKYLPHILIQLKSLGIVESVRGQHGGYLLVKAPKEIRLSEIVQGFSTVKLFSVPKSLKSKQKNILQEIWQETQGAVFSFMDSITFEDIINRQRSFVKVPMYTI